MSELLSYIKDCWEVTISIRERRSAVGGFIGALLAFPVVWILGGVLEPTATGAWWIAVWLTTASLITLIVIAPFQVYRTQRNALETLSNPNLTLDYQNHDKFFKKLEVKRRYSDGSEAKSKGVSIRVSVENTSLITVRNCEAFVTTCERLNGNDFVTIPPYEPMRLRWAMEDYNNPLIRDRIYPNVPALVGVFQTNELDDFFSVQTFMHSFSYPALFREAGIYRFRVVVSAENGSAEPLVLRVHWPGKWDEISLEVEPDEPQTSH